MAVSTVSQESLEIKERLKLSDRFKITNRLIAGSVIAFFSWILLLISLASPYWLSSYVHTFSSFIRLGLFDFCFHDFRHPWYHFDDRLTGCFWIYSHTYYNYRDYLAPDWFIFVQTMIILAFIFSTISLMIISCLLMYYFTKHQVSLMITVCSLLVATVFTIFLGITVFASKAFDRNWLLNPQFNHLDWAYYLAVMSMIFFIIAIILLILETKGIRERKRKLKNLIYNMQPRTMSTLNEEKVAAQSIDDHVDNSEGGVSKLQQHQQQQRYDRNQQLHFTQV